MLNTYIYHHLHPTCDCVCYIIVRETTALFVTSSSGRPLRYLLKSIRFLQKAYSSLTILKYSYQYAKVKDLN